jgi:hypothetical protein
VQPTFRMFHGVKLEMPETEATEDEIRRIFLRMLCHFIVDHIPDAGLPEACESLREFHGYYSGIQFATPLLPQTMERRAVLGERMERPEVQIEE